MRKKRTIEEIVRNKWPRAVKCGDDYKFIDGFNPFGCPFGMFELLEATRNGFADDYRKGRNPR